MTHEIPPYMGLRLNHEIRELEEAGDCLPQALAYALLAYAVEQLYVKEREMARAAAEILTVTQELKALKAKFEAGR
ncbi:hypothetical protein [Mycolicibacterium mageritense]|uniref:hypothetical protein n=1 Tax=Mycolicibacterium mageritense TaxID=53462 RepID=UPI001E46585B|nr:hypothetical protein [Mycolicibacterium mageritense]GJJ24124.1 hypothetical protein MTY414_77980 [Mycolicibacterium mageritense]